MAYRGAFAPEIANRWDLPWAEYDPVNKEYKAEVDTVVNSIGNEGGTSFMTVTPQPANGYAKVQYSLRSAGVVQITVVDALGNTHATIAESVSQETGMYEFVINTEMLSAGGYVVRIISATGISSAPFIVVH